MPIADTLSPEDAKLEKQRLKEEKKKLKNERKAQRKEAKARAKELASQEASLMEDEETNSGSVFMVTFVIVLIWIAILCLVVKLDLGGFGSNVLTPVLKDVPVINMILPKKGNVAVREDESEELSSTWLSYDSMRIFLSFSFNFLSPCPFTVPLGTRYNAHTAPHRH